jgi:hypothetical protein
MLFGVFVYTYVGVCLCVYVWYVICGSVVVCLDPSFTIIHVMLTDSLLTLIRNGPLI